MIACPPSKASDCTAARAAETESPDQSPMSLPAIVTASASGLSRFPWQLGHGVGFIRPPIQRRMPSLDVSRYRRSRLLSTPSNRP